MKSCNELQGVFYNFTEEHEFFCKNMQQTFINMCLNSSSLSTVCYKPIQDSIQVLYNKHIDLCLIKNQLFDIALHNITEKVAMYCSKSYPDLLKPQEQNILVLVIAILITLLIICCCGCTAFCATFGLILEYVCYASYITKKTIAGFFHKNKIVDEPPKQSSDPTTEVPQDPLEKEHVIVIAV